MVVEDNTKISTSISLIDTGKYKVGDSVVSGEKVAFGSDGVAGSKLILKGVELNANFDCMISKEGVPHKKKNDTDTEIFEYPEVSDNGVESPSYTISGVLSKNNVEDLKSIGRLIYMTKTKGYKELYAPLDTSRTDLLSYLKYGEREADGETIKTIDYLSVRIKSLTIKQTSDGKFLRWNIQLSETL